ncbi:2-C-methyl-D-erythritol 4-phosphate cytidylyltransferase [Arthrobacter sp. UYCu511]|uniref:IspD/TarI family cytidylyltransferase n=1 Tax=Arthrobacter sp. UYCu511 TaxID=3156337 RepID=UPI003396D55E
MQDSHCTCILLAGGLGTRFSANGPKQLVELDGRPILSHSFDIVANSDKIDEVIVVVNPMWHQHIKTAISKSEPIGKNIQFVMGGSNRNESVLNGIRKIQRFTVRDKVLVHDSVRPLVTQKLVERVVSALDTADAVIPVIESEDPLINVVKNKVMAIQSRKQVLRGQSPQGFRLEILLDAFSRASSDEIRSATTLYELILQSGVTENISTVPGDFSNIKVTQPIDHAIALSILQESRNV